jgi:ABC-type Mn2+/Zn2+ transport system permease subunit
VPLLILVLVVVLVIAPIVLVPLSLFLRYRAGTARRQARRWVATVNLVGLAISTSLFVTGAALASLWVPHALSYSVLGLLGGFVLGIFGLWLSRWERGPQSLHYTPNRWLVLAVMLVVAARVLFGLWRGWYTWRHAPGETSLVSAFGVAGSLAAGAVVLGYYLSYWMGVRRRLRWHMIWTEK